MLRERGPGRRVLTLGLVLLLPSLVVALGVGWLWEWLGLWSVNEGVLSWRWSVGWLLGTMALSILVDLLPPGRERLERG